MAVFIRWIERYPFLRFDIPLIAGILCADAWPGDNTRILTACVAVGILFVLGLTGRRLSAWYAGRWLYGAVLYLCLFAGAMMWQQERRGQILVEWSREKQAYKGVVSGLPEEKARSWKVQVEVEGKQVLLYLPKDSLSQTWRSGEEILFYTRIYPPLNRGKAEEFDYARYLECKGISGTAYAGNGYWQRGSVVHPPTWKQRALMAREQLVDTYRQWGFEGDELAVISALTLGDKSLLDDDLKEAYSIAGASHILALSGLHLGIVYGLLAVLIGFRPRFDRRDGVRGALLILALWAFAYLTGLSGSVVRAAVMCTIVIMGRCLLRQGSTLNSLALAAFVMLVYNPYYLFDVGFQMSFAAVAGIALFFPLFKRYLPEAGNAVTRYVLDIIVVSLAAQLGVAPLVAYYFDSFSLYFLVTNLVVVPLSFVLLCGGVLLWAVSFWAWLHEGVLVVMKGLLYLLNTVVVSIGQWPYSSLPWVMTQTSVLVFYICLVCALGFYYRRWACYLQVMLVAACLAFIPYIVQVKHSCAYFYSDRLRGDIIECQYADGRSFLIEKAQDKGGLIPFAGKYIGVLQDGYWMDKSVPARLPLEVLYVRKEFRGDFEKVLLLFDIRRVVLEAAVPEYRRKKIEKVCRACHIDVISLDDVGSWRLGF